MRVFTGQYDRTIDAKNRIQFPSQLRAAIDPERDGPGLYVTLGQHRGTLSIFTEQGFEVVSSELETEFEPGEASRRFEVLPDRLVRMAKLGEAVFVVGQKSRIDIWNREALEQAMQLDWEGEDWPDWVTFMRRRPNA